jgi:hypothetical protein
MQSLEQAESVGEQKEQPKTPVPARVISAGSERKPKPLQRLQEEATLMTPTKTRSDRGLEEIQQISERALQRIRDSPAARRRRRATSGSPPGLADTRAYQVGEGRIPEEHKVEEMQMELPEPTRRSLLSRVRSGVGTFTAGLGTAAYAIAGATAPVLLNAGEVVGINASAGLLAAALAGTAVAGWGLKKIWNGLQQGKEIDLPPAKQQKFKQQIQHWNENYDRLTAEQKSNLQEFLRAWQKRFSAETKQSMPTVQQDIDELLVKFEDPEFKPDPEQLTQYEQGTAQLGKSMEAASGGRARESAFEGARGLANIGLSALRKPEPMSEAEQRGIKTRLQRLAFYEPSTGASGFSRLDDDELLETQGMIQKYQDAHDVNPDKYGDLDTDLMMQHLRHRRANPGRAKELQERHASQVSRGVERQMAQHKEIERGRRGGQKPTPRPQRGYRPPTIDPEQMGQITEETYKDVGLRMTDEEEALREHALDILRDDELDTRAYEKAMNKLRDVWEKRSGDIMTYKKFEEWSQEEGRGGRRTVFSDRDDVLDQMYNQFSYLNSGNMQGDKRVYNRLFHNYLRMSQELDVKPEYKNISQFEYDMKHRPEGAGLTDTGTGLKVREGGRGSGGGGDSTDSAASERDKRGRGKGGIGGGGRGGGKKPKRPRRRSGGGGGSGGESLPSGAPGSSISERHAPDGGKKGKGKYVDDPDKLSLAILSSMLQKQPQVIPVATQSSGVVQVPYRQRIPEKPEKQRPQIVVKQTVKQVQGPDKPKRKKRKPGVGKSRKEYNAIKKEVKSRLTAQKKVTFEKHNARIKKLPAKERAAARKKLRAELKARHSRLVKQLRTGKSLKTMDAITAAIRVAKKLKW